MKYTFLNDTREIYEDMLKEIKKAEKSISIQTYIYSNDYLGEKFVEVLTEKAKEGVHVKLLIDAWGSYNISDDFFKKLINAGGHIGFFRPIRLRFDLKNIRRNHKRNHKKILVIDGKISYLGSINIMGISLEWKEYVIKINDKYLSMKLEESITQDEKIKNRIFYRKHVELINYEDVQIIEDTPSYKYQQIRSKYLELINNAKKYVMIENSYFLPDFALRKALRRAKHRGVRILIIQPKYSDVKIFDIARQYLFGEYYKNNYEMQFYAKSVMHSKIIVVDDQHLMIGSTNLDYRSLKYQFEIVFYQKNKKNAIELRKMIEDDLKYCENFDYRKWKSRSYVERLIEFLLYEFRFFL